jgi:hypothetical protein
MWCVLKMQRYRSGGFFAALKFCPMSHFFTPVGSKYEQYHFCTILQHE